MGVPVVSLVGPAFFERMSFSNLSNAGLSDLCAYTREEYVTKAVALAADRPRRQHLRDLLRQQIGQTPLGRPVDFMADFYRATERALS
jgi:protein O-GlcNAc transferase